MNEKHSTQTVPPSPKGRQIFKWLGPGFLWMVSAAGSGELLFTPRVGAMYGYSLLWALLAAVALKWFINREIGRFAVCTGTSLIDGFASLPGPRNLALWVIVVPQALVAVIAIAGLGGGAATALTLFLPGGIYTWMIVSVLTAAALVLWGKYKGVEKASMILASTLALASIVAAISIAPSAASIASGLRPQLSSDIDLGEILPWLGFMLSGAAGLLWYSYWIPAKGYGMAGARKKENSNAAKEIPDVKSLSAVDKKELKDWIKVMSLDTSTAVVGTVIITVSFLILGTELLRPQGLVPEENKVAATLGKLLGSIWGPIGFWFMVTGVFIGFWDTILSDQDGHSRLFANSSLHLFKSKLKSKWATPKFLKAFFVIALVTVLPIALFLLIGNPVELLKLAGAIEAAHIPIVTGLTLYLNRKKLPKELQPSSITFAITLIAGLFFALFAVLYVLQISGVVVLKYFSVKE